MQWKKVRQYVIRENIENLSIGKASSVLYASFPGDKMCIEDILFTFEGFTFGSLKSFQTFLLNISVRGLRYDNTIEGSENLKVGTIYDDIQKILFEEFFLEGMVIRSSFTEAGLTFRIKEISAECTYEKDVKGLLGVLSNKTTGEIFHEIIKKTLHKLLDLINYAYNSTTPIVKIRYEKSLLSIVLNQYRDTLRFKITAPSSKETESIREDIRSLVEKYNEILTRDMDKPSFYFLAQKIGLRNNPDQSYYVSSIATQVRRIVEEVY